MEGSLLVRIIAAFVIFVASVLGVATPSLVHRVTTGRWPAGSISNSHAHTVDSDEPGNAAEVQGDGSAVIRQGGTSTRSSAHRPRAASVPTVQEEDYSAADAMDDADTSNRLDRRSMNRSMVAASSARDDTRASTSGLNYMHVVKLLSALGCGAIIATGTCHIAPAAQDNLSQVWSGDYPYPFAIATVVIIVMYIFEHELTLMLQMREHARAAQEHDHAHAQYEEAKASGNLRRSEAGGSGGKNDVTSPLLPGDPGAPAMANAGGPSAAAASGCCASVRHLDADKEDTYEVDNCDKSKQIRASIATHVLEIGVAVHSVIVGFAMGMLSDKQQAINLTIALFFHQFSEGCAIGAAVLESRLGLKHTLVLWAIFAFTAPGGVLLGIAVQQGQQSDEASWRLTLTQGVLESVALGILLYMALVDMMPGLFRLPAADAADVIKPAGGAGATAEGTTYGTVPSPAASSTVAEAEALPPPGWYRAVLYLCLSTGAAIMCVIANWA